MQEQKAPTLGGFAVKGDCIEVGDIVILYSSPSNVTYATITPGKQFANNFGRYPHDSMIGKKWGSKHPSATGNGFIYLLYPTPELWTLSLPHRTQILYNPDISLISTHLDLRPGVKMIEAGTGSGSFSHAIARTIAPTGHLYTFEFNEERYLKAKEEFADHGLAEMVTAEHRDVCNNGFEQTDLVDAVFLDLPAPWDALAAAKKTFKKNKTGKICCFSPCAEQVLKTTLALQKLGFVDIKMFEILVRPYEVKTVQIRSLPTLDQANCRHTIGRLKRKTREEEPGESVVELEIPSALDSAAPSAAPSEAGTEEEKEPLTIKVEKTSAVKEEEVAPVIEEKEVSAIKESEVKEMVGLKPPKESTGHTSFLTFATLLPQVFPQKQNATA
ncbi:tRNA methyltransferase complex subunit Cpd1 [Powellomyces hirtus]|nr:tRNA methyltransferase complex subunit Cpd1 [Powellomyces hirtus]